MLVELFKFELCGSICMITDMRFKLNRFMTVKPKLELLCVWEPKYGWDVIKVEYLRRPQSRVVD